METYDHLILSFYQSLEKDVTSLFPDCDLSLSWQWLQEFVKVPEIAVRQLSECGKEFDRCLISLKSFVCPSLIPCHEGSVLPEPFYELFAVLLDDAGHRRYNAPDEGVDLVLRYHSNFVLILRQIFLAFSKLVDIEASQTEDQARAAFVERIQQDPNISYTSNSKEFVLARMLMTAVFTDSEETAVTRDLRPIHPSIAQWETAPFGKHGPGAVAGKEQGERKWDFNHVRGVDTQLYALYELHTAYVAAKLGNKSLHSDSCSRLCIVPKDFRSLRAICIEPKELMFAQQGQMKILFDITHRSHLTRRSVNFTNQRLSQLLCRDNRFSTIDLKDASDRVSLDLLRLLCRKDIFAFLTRYRSRAIDCGPLGIVENHRTALTMGNALCFPVETLVFWALSLATMVLEYNGGDFSFAVGTIHALLRGDKRALRRFSLRVFGDDIVIPSRYYDAVCRTLECSGLVVNHAKSCHESLVREACGAYWFAGCDVRITRFSFHKLSNLRVWLSWADNARELQQNGFTSSAETVCALMSKMYPVSRGWLGLPNQEADRLLYRWNSKLQRVEVRVPQYLKMLRDRKLVGERGLYAYFTEAATSAVVPSDLKEIKWTWISIIS